MRQCRRGITRITINIMGLDMYLSKKIYVGAEYCQKPVTVIVKKGDEEIKVCPKKVSYIIETAAYWRKANAIHNWFVKNVQDGVDDCKEYDVSREQLKELLKLCKKVANKHERAEELLPAVDGPFFGDTEYDEYYFTDIKNTICHLSEVLKNSTEDNEFTYCSSW